jgi:hypothetical protein
MVFLLERTADSSFLHVSQAHAQPDMANKTAPQAATPQLIVRFPKAVDTLRVVHVFVTLSSDFNPLRS